MYVSTFDDNGTDKQLVERNASHSPMVVSAGGTNVVSCRKQLLHQEQIVGKIFMNRTIVCFKCWLILF